MLLSHVDVGGDVNCDEWLGLVERNIALNSDHMDVMWESQPELEPPEWNSVKIRGETVLTKMEQLRGVPIAENQEQLLELEWNTQSGKDMEFSVSKSNLREESVHFTTVLNYSDFDLVPVPVSIVSTSVIPEVHVVVTNGVAWGTFVENPKKNYVGGVVEVWNLDPDYVSHGDLCELVIEAGFRGVKSMYYLKPGGSISDGLVLCWDNKSFNDLIGHWLVEGEINVFVEHSVDVLDFVEAPLAIEARVVTHEQGDNRDNTVKEGKTVTESEVIGEGLNNNINCGGPTEGDIEFEDANVNDVGRNINEFEDTSGGVEEEGDRSGGVEEEDKSGGVEEEEGISERSGEVEEGIPPSFERDYEADRFGGDKDEKDEDDILEDVEWVSDREDEELQKIQEHFRSFKKKSQHDAEIDDIVDQVRRRRAAVKEKTTNKSNGAGSETDYIDSSDLGSYETNGDGEVHCKKSKVCCFDPTDLVPCFQLGMLFENSKQFKSTLTRYAIAKRFDFRLAKNDKDKTRAVCKGEGCPFTIYASIDFGDNLYKVKTFVDKHTCSVTFKNSRVNYKVLAEHFLPKLRIIPNLKSTDMVKFAKEELKVDVSMGVCRRARDLAKEEITRNYRHEFKRLFDYANALRRADSDGTIDLLVERPTPNYKLRFKRFYQNNVTSGIESVTQPAAQPESVNQPVAQPESVTQPAAHPESVTQEPGVQPESVTQEPIQHEIVDTIFDMPLNCSSGSQVCVYPSVVRSESRGRKIMEKTQGPKKQVTRTTARKSTSKRSTRNQATSAPTPTLPTPPLYTQELRAYLMELGSKRSLMECDDVPNTQESTTATKKQKKEKQTMTTSKKK
ncbi:hypothetical protein V6N12_058786 [Hibiscus sabdariffa]|uniref:Transposase MuDR plant domain-containing protein n=1 Tax=Hibiscus sabdariffa TaxID=183260 RepID=A0ABR2EX79_9ROSI